jgi:integrase
MSVRHVTINGTQKVGMARIAYRGVRKSRVCRTKEEARQAERELAGECRKDVERAKMEDAAPATLRQLLTYYAGDMEARGKGQESVGRVDYTRRSIEAVTPDLLDKPVGVITDGDIFVFRNARARSGAKPSTVNRDLRTLRAALKKARPGYRFPGGAFFREDETRVRWLRPEEELLVLETMPSPFREIAKLAALTLMRMTEIRTLRRDMVHLEQGVVLLPQAKAGARPVILSGAARKVVQGQMEAHPGADLVFPGPSGRPYSREQIGKAFRRVARAAGLRDFRFHDLRHHGATMALNRGFTAPIVMALGGWKTERMMRRYAAVTDQTLRAAAEAVSGSEAWQGSPLNIASTPRGVTLGRPTML